MTRTEFQGLSNAYWTAPTLSTSFPPVISGNSGFLTTIPYPDVFSTPTTGEGNENIYGKRELVFTTLPQTFAVANVLPMSGGYPRLNTKGLAGTFRRSKYTVQI